MESILKYILYAMALVVAITGLNVLFGGLGRLVSIFAVGLPASILISAMILEFVIPIAIYGIYWKLYIKSISQQ